MNYRRNYRNNIRSNQRYGRQNYNGDGFRRNFRNQSQERGNLGVITEGTIEGLVKIDQGLV